MSTDPRVELAWRTLVNAEEVVAIINRSVVQRVRGEMVEVVADDDGAFERRIARAILASAPTVEQVRQEERERIAAVIKGAGAQIESAQREAHGYLPILESGIVAGYFQAARIAERGGADHE